MRRFAAPLLVGFLVLAPARATPQSTPPTLASLNAREAQLSARLGRERNRLAHLLGALMRLSRDPPPPLLVDARDARRAVNAAILLRALTPVLERRARSMAAEADGLARLRRAAASANGERFAAESEALDLQRVDGLIAGTTPDVLPADTTPPPSEFLRPTAARVSAAYGGRLASGAPSRGMEFRPEAGEAVTSPTAGTVDYAGPLNGWGRVVILRAGGGYHMVLAGLENISVAPGQSVTAGQTIGAMPLDVESGARLYLEVRKDGDPIDPAPLLRSAARTGTR